MQNLDSILKTISMLLSEVKCSVNDTARCTCAPRLVIPLNAVTRCAALGNTVKCGNTVPLNAVTRCHAIRGNTAYHRYTR